MDRSTSAFPRVLSSRLARTGSRVSRIPRGFESPEQFTLLVEPLLPRLVRVAREILGSDDVAWDAVQETLLRVWNRGWLPAEPSGALVHLVKKSSLHQARCLRRRRHHESEAAEAREVCCPDDPLATVEQDERGQAVRDAVARVSEDFRTVLELYDLHGESYEVIAERLDVPIGTVRSRLHRARAMLRRGIESAVA